MSLTRSIGAVQNLETPPATAPEMSRLVLESAGGSSEGLPDRRCRSVGLAVGVLRSRLPSPLMRPNRPLLSPRFSGWCGSGMVCENESTRSGMVCVKMRARAAAMPVKSVSLPLAQ